MSEKCQWSSECENPAYPWPSLGKNLCLDHFDEYRKGMDRLQDRIKEGSKC